MSEARVARLVRSLDTSSDRAAAAAIEGLVRIGRAAVPALVVAASDETRPRIRKWSLEALGALGDPRGARPLLLALADSRMSVRLHAARGLGRLRPASAAAPLARLVRDPSGGVRVNALDALRSLGSRAKGVRPVGAAIVAALGDEAWYVRQHAALACGELGLARARAALVGLAAHDPRRAVREAAAGALAGLAHGSR